MTIAEITVATTVAVICGAGFALLIYATERLREHWQDRTRILDEQPVAHHDAGSDEQARELARLVELAHADEKMAEVTGRPLALDPIDDYLQQLEAQFAALITPSGADLAQVDDLPDDEAAAWSARADELLAEVAASDDPVLIAVRKLDDTDPNLVLSWACSSAPVSALEQTGEIPRITEPSRAQRGQHGPVRRRRRG